ncbi:MAG: universal stress protein [Candidatus Dormibacteraeota bacterium]|nr:universal stress protein [Candidatus Dormibacteraeota bacterium]
MKVMVGVARRGAPELLADLNRILPLRSMELLLVHVIDNGARGEIDLSRRRLLPRTMPRHRLHAIQDAERQAAKAALDEAAAAAEALGALGETLTADGEPGPVMSLLAQERGCDLVALRVREDPRTERAGPHSLGHTARFVSDHSPCPVLLVRGRPPAR